MIIVRDIFEQIVNSVSNEVTPYLQTVDQNIQRVQFMAGHPLEITNRLTKRDDNGLYLEKYPLIALFHDFDEQRGRQVGEYARLSLRLIIANNTSSEFIADQRYEKNFKPILYPIYESLLKQITLAKKDKWQYFNMYGENSIPHIKTDRLFWGTPTAYANTANIFNDYLDCIDIRNLELSLDIKNC